MCDSGKELNVNATSICGIVYELSRLAHDRQQMEHEDQEGKYHRTIQQQARRCEYLEAELHSRDQMIEDLQRQITKSKKTGTLMTLAYIVSSLHFPIRIYDIVLCYLTSTLFC